MMISDIFQIKDKKAVWAGKFNELFRALLSFENEGKFYEVVVTLIKDPAQYFQHKHYRGHLLPMIAKESYDGILAKAHYELKKMFLIRYATDWKEIPKKHWDRITILTRTKVDAETGEEYEEMYGYLPSTAKLSKAEFKEYIEKVEWLCAEMGLHGLTEDELEEESA